MNCNVGEFFQALRLEEALCEMRFPGVFNPHVPMAEEELWPHEIPAAIEPEEESEPQVPQPGPTPPEPEGESDPQVPQPGPTPPEPEGESGPEPAEPRPTSESEPGRIMLPPFPMPVPRFGAGSESGRIMLPPFPMPVPRFGAGSESGRIMLPPFPMPVPRFGAGSGFPYAQADAAGRAPADLRPDHEESTHFDDPGYEPELNPAEFGDAAPRFGISPRRVAGSATRAPRHKRHPAANLADGGPGNVPEMPALDKRAVDAAAPRSAAGLVPLAFCLMLAL